MSEMIPLNHSPPLMATQKPEFTDEEIVKYLLEGPPNKEEQAINYMYTAYQDIKLKYQSSLTDEEVNSIYHDSLMIVRRKIKDGSFELRPGVKIKSYFGKILHNGIRWYFDKGKKEPSKVSLDEVFPNDRIHGIIAEIFPNIIDLMQENLKKLSPKCRAMIQTVELDQMGIEQAWKYFEYKSISVFRAAYARCKNKLRGLM